MFFSHIKIGVNCNSFDGVVILVFLILWHMVKYKHQQFYCFVSIITISISRIFIDIPTIEYYLQNILFIYHQ